MYYVMKGFRNVMIHISKTFLFFRNISDPIAEFKKYIIKSNLRG